MAALPNFSPSITSNEVDFSNWDWARRGTSHVAFAQDEQLPLKEVKILGHGVNGPVCEAVVQGISVAWKRIFCRHRIGPRELREIQIIKKLAHPHIIRLAGSYTQGRYLGLLLYPVAQCDLATFLEDVDFLIRWKLRVEYPVEDHEDERLARCSEISGVVHGAPLAVLLQAATSRLWGSLGCIASAIAYLHRNGVRHKDLKPLNILLSRNGIWLSDFGHSTDFSNFSDSATSGNERGTIKYCAPEVAAYERSGRSADIFSLGCIFFEMVGLRCYTLQGQRGLRSARDGSFHNNLATIFDAFETFGSTALDHLPMSLVRRMLSKNPEERPLASEICKTLSIFTAFSVFEPDIFSHHACACRGLNGQNMPYSRERGSFAQEVIVVIGNTCHEAIPETLIRGGRERSLQPAVFFVECSSTDLIASVIFFDNQSCSSPCCRSQSVNTMADINVQIPQHSSSTRPIRTFYEPPFAWPGLLWGVYTQAVVIILKPGYLWDSSLATLVPWEDGHQRSVLPLIWDLQLGSTVASKIHRENIWKENV